MAEHSTIEWTDATWNPITGCSIVSPGCTNCYAMRLAGTRLKHHPSRKGLTVDTKAGPVWNGRVRLNLEWLTQPMQWRRPRRIFVCAHSDLFGERVPDEWIDQVFAVMALAPWHTYQVLTKRAARMREWATERWQAAPAQSYELRSGALHVPAETHGDTRWDRINHALDGIEIPDSPLFWTPEGDLRVRSFKFPLPNVWMGVSAEDQRRADERVPDLLATPAAVRFMSAEPLLGPLDLSRFMWPVCGWWLSPHRSYREAKAAGAECGLKRQALVSADARFLDWVIAGGESGPEARPMHPDWVRSLRDQCAAAGVPFHFKQWGAWASALDRDQHDPDWRADYGDELNDRRRDIAWLNLAGGCGFHGDRFHVMRRLGKAAAGRVLDGRTHDAMPATADSLPSRLLMETA